MLGDRHAASRDGQGGHGGDVDAVQLVAAGAHHVDGLGTDGKRRRGSDHGVNESGHLVECFALGRDRREEARDEDSVHSTLEDLYQRGARFVAFERRSTHEGVENVERERTHGDVTQVASDIATR